MLREPERDSKTRFSDRVDDYVRARPHYPPDVLRILADELRQPAPWRVADVGSGTGIFAEPLLRAGHRVWAVEPNAPMRAAAERQLGVFAHFVSVSGSAEATTLPDRSFDLVTAAQAFHWFDLARTRAEFLRILRPGGRVAAVWNTRRSDSPFGAAYEALLTGFGTDYARVGQSHRDTPRLFPGFFGTAGHRHYVIRHCQHLDLAGLRARLLSSSYIPGAGEPGHEAMMAELDAIHRRHQHDGLVTLEYDCEIYAGRLS